MATEKPSGQSLEHSISPGVPCPETVMVALMSDGGYLLVGRCREMPMAFIAPGDAAALRDALDTAFGKPVSEPGGGGPCSELGGHTLLLISAMRC